MLQVNCTYPCSILWGICDTIVTHRIYHVDANMYDVAIFNLHYVGFFLLKVLPLIAISTILLMLFSSLRVIHFPSQCESSSFVLIQYNFY